MPELNVFSTKKILLVAQSKMVEVIGFNFCLLFSIYFRNLEFARSRTFILLLFITFKNITYSCCRLTMPS